MSIIRTARAVVWSLIALVVLAACGHAAPVIYNRSIRPLGNGFGVASIVDTEASTDPLYLNRYVSGSGICSGFSASGGYRVNGAMLDYGNVTGQKSAANDIIGFYFTYDPNSPDSLNVWRNVIANIDPFGTGNIRSFGYGGVSQTGLLCFRMDGNSGGIPGNAIGTLPVDQASTTTFTTGYSGTGYTLLGGGAAITSTWTVGPIGETTGMAVSSNFAKYLGRFHSTYADGGGNFTPHGQIITPTNTDHRGSPAINDTAKVIASCTQAGSGEPSFKGEYFRLRVIKYAGTGPAYTEVSQTTYNFKNIGDGNTYAFANFFSRSAYGGPQQISINDHGDIAFPVVINVAGGSTTDDTPYRFAPRRGILFMSHDTPGVFKCVVDNALAGPALFYDDRPSPSFAPCIAGVAIDNDCNVYFSGANWMGYWPTDSTADVVSTNAIYKAKADVAGNPSKWSIEPILWRGMTWKEDTGAGAKGHELTILPLGNSGAEWFANSAAFCCQSINRTRIPGKTDPRYGVGGLFLGVGLGIDGMTGNTMRGIYLAPTDQRPATTNVAQASALADGEPVNLYNCAITAFRDVYTSTSGSPYYRYDISDGSGKLMISTIRSNDPAKYRPLCVGDKVCVSGFMATDSATGERYLSSGGLVTTGVQIYAMSNKSVGIGYGPSTVGKRVRVWGKVSPNWDYSNAFMLDDGSGKPILVDYSNLVGKITEPSEGQYASVDGVVTSASPATVSMVADSTLKAY